LHSIIHPCCCSLIHANRCTRRRFCALRSAVHAKRVRGRDRRREDRSDPDHHACRWFARAAERAPKLPGRVDGGATGRGGRLVDAAAFVAVAAGGPARVATRVAGPPGGFRNLDSLAFRGAACAARWR